MAFKFRVLCDLLTTLEEPATRDPPLLSSELRQRTWQVSRDWFRAHRRAIDGLDTTSTVALLSCLLPERRTDRVYGLQNVTLARLLSRALGLPASKARDLNAYRDPGRGDLGQCLERALQDGGPPGLPVVTVEEIDVVLAGLASNCRFSNPAIQTKAEHSLSTGHAASLANIFQRLLPNEAKWLVRLILKDFAPVRLDDRLILRSVHFLLPDILRFQYDFDVAVNTLKGPLKAYPSCPDQQSEPLLQKLVSSALRPVVGIKVARPAFCKARSIEHCLNLMGRRRWMLERKYDGEYCEMHIDLTKGDDWLKIFSKRAKDSTEDRAELKHVLRKCLGIGTPRCKIQSRCILLGEMLVWCDITQAILPFHKIHKHVTRSGIALGVSKDSQTHPHEHLMIVFYDLLVLDDAMILNKPVEHRKAVLNGLYRKKEGRAMTAESKVLDFSETDSKRKLIAHLASSIASRHEGLVLKPCGQPYFSIARDTDSSSIIKLKKDYIKGLGDEADFAVIGASYKARDALRLGLTDQEFTHFHLGCLTNKESVQRFDARPCFKIVGTIGCDQCIPRPELARANRHAAFTLERLQPAGSPSMFDLDSSGLQTRMDVVFRGPCVFEVLGSSYVKPSDADFWMLRHPRVQKMHEDRTWRDCVSFDELQAQALAAVEHPQDAESQENLVWLERVEQSCKRKIARRLASISPKSAVSTTPARSSTPARSIGSRATTITPEGVRVLGLISPNATARSAPTTSPTKQRVVFEVSPQNGKRPLPTPPTSSPCIRSLVHRSPKRRAADRLKLTAKRVRIQEPVFTTSPQPMRLDSSFLMSSAPKMPRPALDTIVPATVADDSGALSSYVVYVRSSDSKSLQLAASTGAIVISNLAAWDRLSDAYDPLADTVGESQSYPGLRKGVLVRSQASVAELMDVVAELGRLDCGRGIRDRIDFFTGSESCEERRDRLVQLGHVEWNALAGESELRLQG